MRPEIAAVAGAELAGKKTDKGKARPLADPKWAEQLDLHVLEGRFDTVDCRDRHAHLAKVRSSEVTLSRGFGQSASRPSITSHEAHDEKTQARPRV
jgi:hypothetical protein